jgi:4-diphosphocytidyl-2-C-methyl-D-erythritol kinase
MAEIKLVHVKSYAKVNLTLEVVGILNNNYHEISSVIQMIDFADDIDIETATGLTVACSRPDLDSTDNLAYMALVVLQRFIDRPLNVSVRIEKNMPIAAGLGGGTSNAVTTLLAVCKLLEIRLHDEDLHAIAKEIGADASYFLHGGTALASKWGEKIQVLPDAHADANIILLPASIEESDKTSRMYGMLDTGMFSDGSITNTLVSALEAGDPVTDGHLYNVFDRVALRMFPGIETSWKDFATISGTRVQLCGSGPTLFTVVPAERASTVAERMRFLGYDPIIGSMVGGRRV